MFMDQLEDDEPDANVWLEREAKSTWARSYFDFTTKCDVIANNFILITYHVNAFRATYAGWIFSFDNEDEWGKIMPGDEVLPPTIERKVGRPRKQRIRGDDEERATSKRKCRKCKEPGRNSRTCPHGKNGKNGKKQKTTNCNEVEGGRVEAGGGNVDVEGENVQQQEEE
ncbi:hypothetical protein IFM89_021311 [Coptis chinensis]|uniref:CCHC-type domain-containing protein n=1 Tax=Coptis chinensis TaxID=261450 RepID=A0A835HU23_9MAGN|nr:hypothetical protein IFM89_021311 [Coptis chinensis]